MIFLLIRFVKFDLNRPVRLNEVRLNVVFKIGIGVELMAFKTGISVELMTREINVRFCSMHSVRLVIETKRINEQIKYIFILITSTQKLAKKPIK